ncbi:MAG: hypothetical protein L3J41_04725 [Melioribacteraceae bacterium]|nr:hypothetical protein [Melioribacteraceae bacterium]
MKKLFLISFIISIAITAQDFKRYEYKSGKVVYKSSGSVTGTETMYFDNYGMVEVKNTKSTLEMMGIKRETDTKVIMKDKWLYTIDNKTGEANKMENPIYSMFPEGGDLEKAGEEMMINMGGKKVGTETLLGKECDIWEIEKLMSKVWVWKSIPLKSEVSMMGISINQIATSVEVDIDVSPDEFKIPEGVEFKDIGNIDINSLMGN